MTMPSLPEKGSKDWYAWGQAAHAAVEEVTEGRLTDAELRATSVAAVEDATAVAPTGAWDFTQAPTVAGVALGPPSGGTSLGWKSVKDYGAVGNGAANDTAAIQAALNAASSGGVVFFPPGTYLVSAPLTVTAGVQIVGSESASAYWGYSTAVAPSTCAIRVAAGFTGGALFPVAGSVSRLSLTNLTLLGANVGAVHALDFADAGTEQNFVADRLAIIGFGGDGIRGNLLASRLSNFFIGGCHGWGLNATIGFVDTRFVNGFVAGNVTGGVNLAGTQSSGFCDFTNVRFERSGWNSAAVSSPTAVGSPGIRIRRANDCRFVACETDANSGHGLDVALGSSDDGAIYDLDFIGCHFKRDGFGSMSAQGEYAAVKVAGFDNAGTRVDLSEVRFVDCTTTAAYATDNDTGPAYQHPKYGLWWERTAFVSWIGGRVEAAVTPFYGGTLGWQAGNWLPRIDLARRGLATLPVVATAGRPANPPEGAAVADTTVAQQATYINGAWRTPVTNDGGVTKAKVLTQAAYDALGTKDAATLYVIQG